MPPRHVRLALVQMRCAGAPHDNLDHALRGIAEAARAGADLVVLPELFLGPYFCQRRDDRSAFDLAEPVPGPTTRRLAAAAKEHRLVLVGGSVFEKAPDGKFYNTAAVFQPDGSLAGTY